MVRKEDICFCLCYECNIFKIVMLLLFYKTFRSNAEFNFFYHHSANNLHFHFITHSTILKGSITVKTRGT